MEKLRNGQQLNAQNQDNTADVVSGENNQQAHTGEENAASKSVSVNEGIRNLRNGRKFSENETLAPVQKTTLDKSKLYDNVRQCFLYAINPSYALCGVNVWAYYRYDVKGNS